ncbi:MAG: radical SAM protein, partial [Calditrichia bacterium]
EYGASAGHQTRLEIIRELLEFCTANGTEFLEYGIFPSETRPNTFSPELVKLLAGYCSNKKIAIGAQSGSERLLKKMRRGHGVEEISHACRLTREAGLQPVVDVIIGFPEENPDDRRDTLKLIKKLHRRYQARIQVHYFLPLTGTPLKEEIPAKIDYRTQDLLNRLEADGVCTGWWKAGIATSRQLLEIRKLLEEREIEFREYAVKELE